MLKNKNLLLAIVGILVFLRFVVVPWQAYQADLAQQLAALTKRFERSEALVKQQQTLTEWQTLQQTELTQRLTSFPVVANSAQYRLPLQQQLQQLAAEQQVSVTFFDWLSDTPLNVFGLQRARISLRLEGPAGKVMLVHSQLEQRFPHFMVRDLRGSWRGSISPSSQMELTLLIEADFQNSEAL